MDYKVGICSKCTGEFLIVNKTFKLCDTCNYKRLHKGKSKYEVSKEKERSKAKTYKTKPTGELELFKEIWLERPHKSELSGENLLSPTNLKWINQFLHVLPKSLYPKFRLNKDNILLGLPEEHDRQEEFEVFNEKKNKLRQEYNKFYGR